MQDFVPFLVFIVAAIVIIGGVVISYTLAQKRKEALFLLAQQMGFEFSQEDPFDIPGVYGGFDKLSQGDSRRAYNVIYGSDGKNQFKAFDYKYSTGSGKSRQTHYLSAVIMDTSIFFHQLSIRPETILDRAAGALGFEDINFESEEFSRRFYVKSGDKQFAYDVIHPRMMEFLMSNPGLSINLFANSVLVYTGISFPPEKFSTTMLFCKEFIGLFPEYLVKKLQGGN